MSLSNLDNLVAVNQLKKEPFSKVEFLGLIQSGKRSLKDACNLELEPESRFLLSYNAAHSLALGALRWHGYRADNRYIVFQVLPHTVNAGPEIWRILAKCHDRRNVAEYEGFLEVDDQLLSELTQAVKLLLILVEQLDSHPS